MYFTILGGGLAGVIVSPLEASQEPLLKIHVASEWRQSDHFLFLTVLSKDSFALNQ